jgi:hypothetical protein
MDSRRVGEDEMVIQMLEFVMEGRIKEVISLITSLITLDRMCEHG